MTKRRPTSRKTASFNRRRKPHFEILENRRLLTASTDGPTVAISSINQYGTTLFGNDWQDDLGMNAAQIQQHIQADTWRSALNDSPAPTITRIRQEVQYLGAETFQAQIDSALESANLQPIDVRELDWLQERLTGPAVQADYFSDGQALELLTAEGETPIDDRPMAYLKFATGNDVNNENDTFEGNPGTPNVDGTYPVVIGISEVPDGSITVGWEAKSGTATANVDFLPSQGSVTFTETSEGEKTEIILIVNDQLDELDERFSIELTPTSASDSYRIDPDRRLERVRIRENDLRVSIFDAAPVTEEDVYTPWVSQMPQSRFRVTISSARPEPVSIPWKSTLAAPPYSADQLALLGPDYYHSTSTIPDVHDSVVFNPGETEKFIDIGVVSDRLYELTEYFYVDIAESWLHHIQYTVDDPRALGTINDNDPFPELAIDDVSVEETDGTATLTVTMTNRSSFPVSFAWTLADQSATRPEDYDYHAASGTVTIPAGGGPDPHLEHFTFEIIDDFLTEPDETFRLTINNAVNANITKATGVVTILANDPQVDIDVDSNNNAVITAADDPIEMNAPGKVVLINRDDDNANGVADYSDAGPLANPDDDLEPVNLAFIQAGLPQDELDQLVVRLTYSANVIRVWDTPTKNHRIASDRWWTIGQFNQLPDTLFMEGIGSGQGILTLTLHRFEGDLSTIILPEFGLATMVHFDAVLVTVLDANLTGHTPITEPFQVRPIAEANEEDPGVHIRRNGDDDNSNGSSDRNDMQVENENDLIQVAIATGIGGLAGIRFELERGSNDIRVWASQNKGTPLFAGNNLGPIALDWWAHDSSVWVEWVTPGTGQATSSLDLRLIDTTNNVVIATDRLVFHPFTSVVIVLGGEDQEPADPVLEPNNHGIFRSAIDLYLENYDVHMYNEDLVGWEETPWTTSIPYQEVVNAVQNRGVTNVAIYGYSHGGGSTYLLATKLNLNVQGILTNITQPFTVVFTSYIDAITDDTPFAENRRPPLSQFHVNQFQQNTGSEGFYLNGGPSGADDDLNRSNLNVVHTTIDDHPVVLGLLLIRFRQRVTR